MPASYKPDAIPGAGATTINKIDRHLTFGVYIVEAELIKEEGS